jgi:hypothetical protein
VRLDELAEVAHSEEESPGESHVAKLAQSNQAPKRGNGTPKDISGLLRIQELNVVTSHHEEYAIRFERNGAQSRSEVAP